MKQPEAAIIILNWNQAEETLRCLEAVGKLSYPNHRVLVVDNGSRDESVRKIREAHPDLEVVANEKNLGFAAGCNRGIQKAMEHATPYFMFLNNDTRIDPECLTHLVSALEADSRRGIVGAVNYEWDAPECVLSVGQRFVWWRGALERLFLPPDRGERVFNVQSVSGSCFLVRRELFERVGLLDERFFIYYEETDFCLRALRAGYAVTVHRQARVRHRGANTFGSRTPAEYYLFTRNHTFCLLRHCPKVFLPNALLFHGLKLIYQCIRLVLRGEFREAKAIGGGLWDVWKGRFGEGRLSRYLPGGDIL